MLDFMGLAASYTDKFYEKHVIVIGMVLMPGNHSAEYIKETIETLINRYKFDKSVINGNDLCLLIFKQFKLKSSLYKGVSSDEGSAYVRCFRQFYDPLVTPEKPNDQPNNNVEDDDNFSLTDYSKEYDQEIIESLNSFKSQDFVNKIDILPSTSNETNSIDTSNFNFYSF